VPVIFSPANDGLTRANPLLNGTGTADVLDILRLDSGIDAMGLYNKLGEVRTRWPKYSRLVYDSYTVLELRTRLYNQALFKRIIEDYPNREHDIGFFESPFKEGIPWQEIQQDL
jgi:hypothetical protein